MEGILRDLRYAVRRILRSPGFSAVAVLSLALGIGANSAIFTMIEEVLLSEPPYSEPQDLVEIYPSESGRVGLAALSNPELVDIREGTQEVFSDVVSTSITMVQQQLDAESRTLAAEVVSGNFFDALGLRPAVGRAFLPEEDVTPDAVPVIMLSHSFWKESFAGDPEVAGSSIRLNGRRYRIVGVAPAEMPSLIPGIPISLYGPMMMTNHLNASSFDRLTSRGNHSLFAKGRLRPGVSMLQAQAVVDRVVAATHEQHPDYADEWGLTLVPTSQVAIHPLFDRFLYPAAAVLLAVSGMVLLIACVNLASFLLARARDRRRELSVRMALGARRWSLVRQLLTETVLLAVLGGTAGVLLAAWALRFVNSIELPSPVPVQFPMSPDLRVLLFSLAVSLLSGVLFGILPGWHSANADIAPVLKSESITGRPSRKLNLRNGLVVTQVAVSFLLLISSGLFLRSLLNAQSTDPGFGREPTSIVWLNLLPDEYDNARALDYYTQILDQSKNLPGVEAVGLVDNLALGGTSFNTSSVNIEGVQPPTGRQAYEIDSVVVDEGFFEAAGVPLLAGRGFTLQDQRGAPGVAVVSKAMADRFWPGQDPLGKAIVRRSGTELRVVGVAADTNVRRLGEAPISYIYLPLRQRQRLSLQIIAKTAADPKSTGDQILQIAKRLEPDVMVVDVKTMREHLGFMLFPFRIAGSLLTVFGAMALLLASIGLYGVVRYSVASRTREMGIRMSLGARSGRVIRLVMREGLTLAAVGLALGGAMALSVTPLLESLLFGIQGGDFPTLLGVGLLLILTAVAATLGPALRAGRIDPIQALRHE